MPVQAYVKNEKGEYELVDGHLVYVTANEYKKNHAPEKQERLPGWMGYEYGWDYLSDVNWNMLRNNLKSADYILGNPSKFPRADFAKLEFQSNELHAFLASHAQHLVAS